MHQAQQCNFSKRTLTFSKRGCVWVCVHSQTQTLNYWVHSPLPTSPENLELTTCKNFSSKLTVSLYLINSAARELLINTKKGPIISAAAQWENCWLWLYLKQCAVQVSITCISEHMWRVTLWSAFAVSRLASAGDQGVCTCRTRWVNSVHNLTSTADKKSSFVDSEFLYLQSSFNAASSHCVWELT